MIICNIINKIKYIGSQASRRTKLNDGSLKISIFEEIKVKLQSNFASDNSITYVP